MGSPSAHHAIIGIVHACGLSTERLMSKVDSEPQEHPLMVCASPNQPQAQHATAASPYSCPDRINLTYGGGQPLGSSCYSGDVKCSFPFTYDGKPSYQCSTMDSGGFSPWCYNQIDAQASNAQACYANATAKGCQVVVDRHHTPQQRNHRRTTTVHNCIPRDVAVARSSTAISRWMLLW